MAQKANDDNFMGTGTSSVDDSGSSGDAGGSTPQQNYGVSGTSAEDAQGSKGTQTSTSASKQYDPNKPTSSGNFQNLTAYLNANKNYNAAGGGLAGQINQNLYNQGNQVNQNFQDAQNTYNQQVKAGTVNYDPNSVNNVLNDPYAYTDSNGNPIISEGTKYNGYTYTDGQWIQDSKQRVGPGNRVNPVLSNQFSTAQNLTPNDVKIDDPYATNSLAGSSLDPSTAQTDLTKQYANGQLQAYQNQLNANYQGPTQLDADGTLQAQAQNYQNLTNQVGNENGRFNLLNQLYGGANYSSGARSLDNLILQGNPNQLAQLQGARTMGNQLTGQLAQDQTQAANDAAQAQSTTADTAAKTLGATNNAITGFDTQEATNAQAAMTNRDKQYQDVQNQLLNGNLDYKDAAAFGLLGNGGTSPNIYNLQSQLPSYLTEATNQATNQNVASTADYNKIQALGNLLGSKSTGDISKIISSYGDPTQAGTFANAPAYNFNNQQFTADTSAAGKAYNDAATPYKGQITDATNALSKYDIPALQKQAQQDPNSVANLILSSSVNPEQQKITNATQLLKGITNKYNPNAVLNITGAPQLGNITPTVPGNMDYTNPTLSALGNIANGANRI